MLGLRRTLNLALTEVFKTHHYRHSHSLAPTGRSAMADDLADALEEQLYLGNAAGRGKGKGRSGGGGRRGGGEKSRTVEVSKALSRLLRHQAENAGIKLDEEGYAPLDRVVCFFLSFCLSVSSPSSSPLVSIFR